MLESDLPLDLPVILGDLRHIDAALKTIGARLAVSSFLWLADDRLRLVPGRANERGIYWYLNGNDVFWPLTYHDIRRFSDFQNRVFQEFAQASGAHFVDLARWFPRDPSLFIDAVHLSYPGVKLHGWITFLQLLPAIEERLAAHAETTAAPRDTTPAFSTMTVSAIQEKLRATASPLPLPPLREWRAAAPAVHVTVKGSSLLVEGGGARWAYQIVSPAIPVEPDTTYRVTLPATVKAGVIGVGVLDQSGQTWVSPPVDLAPFTFSSGANTTVQLVVADATPEKKALTPSVFEVRQTR